MTEETLADLDPKWSTPRVTDDRRPSWLHEVTQGTSETVNALRCFPSDPFLAETADSERSSDLWAFVGWVWYDRIKALSRRRGTSTNGYHDFEGPAVSLERVGLVERMGDKPPDARTVSPSCVGGGTSRTRPGEPARTVWRLTPLGVRVRDYWLNRDPWTGNPYRLHTPEQATAEIVREVRQLEADPIADPV